MFPRLLKRGLQTYTNPNEVITAVCPGQGNISPYLFSMIHHELITKKNSKYIELLKHAQSIVPEVNISEYFLNPNFPVDKSELSQTTFVQPLVLLATYMNYSLFKDMYDWDLRSINYFLGHSLGELSALVVQDVVSLEDGLRVAYQRGKLMENAMEMNKMKFDNNNDNEWGMIALLFRSRDFTSILKVCSEDIKFNIANINGYDQIVVSGRKSELNYKLNKLDNIQKELINAKQWKSRIKKVWLKTKMPAHHPIFKDIQDELKSMITLKSENLIVPMVCNLNGLIVVKNSQRVVDNFVNVTSQPVQFVKCLETVIASSNLKSDDAYKFLNVSDVTYGLISRFFNNDHKVHVYDLIDTMKHDVEK